MKKHLDVLLVLVAIVGVGNAASLFGQAPVQQQQLGGPGLGGNTPPGMGSVFRGGSGGGVGGSLGSSLGPIPGSLGVSGGRGSTDRSRRRDFGLGNGGSTGGAGLQGLLGGNGAGGPFNGGVGGPAGSGSIIGSLGSGSAALAPNRFGQSAQQLAPGAATLGGTIPGDLDSVLGRGSGSGLGGRLDSSLGSPLGGPGGGGGATDQNRQGVFGDSIGNRGSPPGLGGPLPGGTAGGLSNRGVGFPTERGSDSGAFGGGIGTDTGSGVLGLGTPLRGSRPQRPGPQTSGLGLLPGSLGGMSGSSPTAGGPTREGPALPGSPDTAVGFRNPGDPSRGASRGPGGSALGPGAFNPGGGSGSPLGSPTSGLGTPMSEPEAPRPGQQTGGLGGTPGGLGGIPGSSLTPGGPSWAGPGLSSTLNTGVGIRSTGGPSSGGLGGQAGSALGPGSFSSGSDLGRPTSAFSPGGSSGGIVPPGVTGGNVGVGASLPTPALGGGLAPVPGGDILSGSPSGTPGGALGPGSPSLAIGGGPSARGSVGPGGAMSSPGGISTGPGSISPVERGNERAGQRLRGSDLSGRPTSPRRPHAGKLSPEKAAAIGLSAASTALALGALAAGIASVVQNRQRMANIRPARIACVGCAPRPCVGNCGRKRRSIALSKVPAEVLNSIPANFERLY